ncbi:MAG: hypothetical protein R3190_06215 [Thermoanaerobaculia bacterium]|nr:hypothetical protein [Thermoanaerobaculia bacterium]
MSKQSAVSVPFGNLRRGVSASRWLAVVGAVLAVSAAGRAGAASRVDDEATTTWRQLTWDDFRGAAQQSAETAGVSSTIVLEVPSMDVRELDDGTFAVRPQDPQVYAVMNKVRSGVGPGGKSDEKLAHEQVHFDITEVHARRLHAKMPSVEAVAPTRGEVLAVFTKAMRALHAEANEALEEMQESYDLETKHGKRKKAQMEWAEKVAGLLAAEEPYPLQ